TAQALADKITQSSTGVRQMRSTVIVQIDQQEKVSAATRNVTNHNHCHALTVLYYEMLRHYRVEITELYQAPVWLLSFDTTTPFTREEVVRQRIPLERALLDLRLLSAFDAVERVVYDDSEPTSAPPMPQPSAAPQTLSRLELKLRVEEEDNNRHLWKE